MSDVIGSLSDRWKQNEIGQNITEIGQKEISVKLRQNTWEKYTASKLFHVSVFLVSIFHL